MVTVVTAYLSGQDVQSVRRFSRTLVILLAASLGHVQKMNADDETPVWRTGKTLQNQLKTEAGMTWDGQSLQGALTNLSRVQRIYFWLDRRVDPQQIVRLRVPPVPLHTAIDALADRLDLGTSVLDNMVYVGPKETVTPLATIVQLQRNALRKQSPVLQTAMVRRRAMKWDILAKPQTILQELADEANVRIENLGVIPHDLWPARQTPPMSLLERLDVVLAGFGKTFRIAADGSSLTIIDIPTQVRITKTYSPKQSMTQVTAAIRRMFPNVNMKTEERQLLISGRYEDHVGIERLLRGEKTEKISATRGETRFTLEIRNQPIDGVARALAKRFEVECTFAPAVRDKEATLISFRVMDVSKQELLRK